MRSFLFLVLCVASIALFADARFVEAPAECHIPWDNANVDNEFKLQSCEGQLNSRDGGNVYHGALFIEIENLSGNMFIIDGEDVRDMDAYPGGTLTVNTSGDESGTDCNIVVNGTTYSTPNWNGVTRVTRTANRYRVNVSYELGCWGAVQAQ